MSARCFLSGLALAPGRHAVQQSDLAARLRERIADLPGSSSTTRMIGFVYQRSAIEVRHVEASPEDLNRRGWYRLTNDATLAMSRRALDALFAGQTRAADCDGFISVTSSFAGFPSLTRRLQEALGFPAEALCYDLTGLGCAGPTHALQLACLLVERGLCRNVCVLAVDAMATYGESRRHHTVPSMSQVVAHCLGSDGAAAAVVSHQPGPETRLSWSGCELHSRLWPDSLSENDFTAGEDDQPLIAVGKSIRTRLLDELMPLLEQIGSEPALFHPGGAALMRALAGARPHLAGTLELSSEVLQLDGNLGAASLLWVLDRALRERRTLTPRLRLVALGPGIVSTVLRLDRVEAAR